MIIDNRSKEVMVTFLIELYTLQLLDQGLSVFPAGSYTGKTPQEAVASLSDQQLLDQYRSYGC